MPEAVRVTRNFPQLPGVCTTYEVQLDAAAGISTPTRARPHSRSILGAYHPTASSCAHAGRPRRSSRPHRPRCCRRRSSGTLGNCDIEHVFSPRHDFRCRDCPVRGAALPGTEAGITRPHPKARLKYAAHIFCWEAAAACAHPRARTSFTAIKITVQIMKSTTNPQSSTNLPCRHTPGRCGASR
jgi:hypothetical protein